MLVHEGYVFWEVSKQLQHVWDVLFMLNLAAGEWTLVVSLEKVLITHPIFVIGTQQLCMQGYCPGNLRAISRAAQSAASGFYTCWAPK